MGTIEIGVEEWESIWGRLLEQTSLRFVCVGNEEGVELCDAQIDPDRFPWTEWPLLIGAVCSGEGGVDHPEVVTGRRSDETSAAQIDFKHRVFRIPFDILKAKCPTVEQVMSDLDRLHEIIDALPPRQIDALLALLDTWQPVSNEEFGRRLAEAPEEEVDEESTARVLAAETEHGENISQEELMKRLGL